MGMTKQERTELGQLIRKREKVMKAQAEERSAQLLAEFEAHAAKIYHWDDDAHWSQIKAEADVQIAAATEAIVKRARELGIPSEFCPELHLFWNGRGNGAVRERRNELRYVAKKRIEALEKEALSKIERISLEAQTKLLADGLNSDEAKNFLDKLASIDALMPSIDVAEINSLVETQDRERAARIEQRRYLQ